MGKMELANTEPENSFALLVFPKKDVSHFLMPRG
jgi:hypothetical protein